MKIEKFNKNKNQKKIVVGSIVGILLIIGSIVFLRSYALYEEEKEFNVLKGQIPDFGYDIKMLSVVVDGEKSKNIPTRGMYKTQIDCSNGTRGEWDYNAWNLTLENVSENARCNITFTSNLSDEEYNQYIEAGKALRRNTYRGKDITSYHEDGSLYEMISSGRFDDIYVGDYIIANNVRWLVADIDNYLYSGYKEGEVNGGALMNHHLTIIPSSILINTTMNETNTTEGGYYNSKMKQETLPNVLNTYIKPVFGEYVLNYYSMLTNSIDSARTSAAYGRSNSGASNGWAWYESAIDLMSEANVTGITTFSSSGYDTGIDNQQYAIFALRPMTMNTCNNGKKLLNMWLKNVVSIDSFGFLDTKRSASLYQADLEAGVRPRFLIG